MFLEILTPDGANIARAERVVYLLAVANTIQLSPSLRTLGLKWFGGIEENLNPY
jgi:hypothetical protein